MALVLSQASAHTHTHTCSRNETAAVVQLFLRLGVLCTQLRRGSHTVETVRHVIPWTPSRRSQGQLEV